MNFPPDLQKRAADFISRPVPAELQRHYVAGSVAEMVIGRCARAQPIDPELGELAELALSEYADAIATARTPDLKAYYGECQQLLNDILKAGC